MRLPLVVGFGGINAAGRSSGHRAYRRMVVDALQAEQADATWASLAALTGIHWDGSDQVRNQLREASLVRRIESSLFDVDAVPWNRRINANSGQGPTSFTTQPKHLPDVIPEGWRVSPVDDKHVRVDIEQGLEFLVPAQLSAPVKAAGQLPSGFDPGKLYQSRSHPRGLQMTVYAASDALAQTGIDWQQIQSRVPVDQISVYAGSGMSQLDAQGNGGLVKARANGKKVTSKYCPFGFAEMPADFVNAYVLGSLGSTGTSMGACASFLYNLRQGIHDIQSGRSRVAIVGNAEAPITADVMEGYAAMGALASDKALRELDGLAADEDPDYRRACRPFANNCGFTIAESAQMVVLFDDELALELGACVYGAVTDVFVNADGHKKSISAPGIGNYITMAKAASAARAIVGEQAMREGGLVQAHGTGTPQNRVTESHILEQVAAAHGIEDWPVVAVKAYLGHSIGAAGADQLVSTLGIWQDGIAPGIATIDAVADDVYAERLSISASHKQLDPAQQRYAIINAKGFGGNNASATVLAPAQVEAMLAQRHGSASLDQWRGRREQVEEAAASYDAAASRGETSPTYKFDHNVLGPENIELGPDTLRIASAGIELDLSETSPYADMLG